MSSRAQNDVILYALLGRKITPAPQKKTVSTRRERNREYAKVSGGFFKLTDLIPHAPNLAGYVHQVSDWVGLTLICDIHPC